MSFIELPKTMFPCIIWIPYIHDQDGNKLNDLSLALLVNSLSTRILKNLLLEVFN